WLQVSTARRATSRECRAGRLSERFHSAGRGTAKHHGERCRLPSAALSFPLSSVAVAATVYATGHSPAPTDRCLHGTRGQATPTRVSRAAPPRLDVAVCGRAFGPDA